MPFHLRHSECLQLRYSAFRLHLFVSGDGHCLIPVLSWQQLLLFTVLAYLVEKLKPCDLIVMVIAIRLKELTTCSLVKRGN